MGRFRYSARSADRRYPFGSETDMDAHRVTAAVCVHLARSFNAFETEGLEVQGAARVHSIVRARDPEKSLAQKIILLKWFLGFGL